MADAAPPPAGGGKPKIKPGELFAYALAIGIGGGIAIWAIMFGFASGVDVVGQVKRRYPEVIMGIIFLGLLISFIVGSKKKEGGH